MGAITSDTPATAGPMPVCAATPGMPQPQVSLATRPINRVPPQRAERAQRAQRAGIAEGGELALIRAIQASRSGPASRQRGTTRCASEGSVTVAGETLSQELAQALKAGDAELAFAHATLLWRQAGLAAVYEQMSRGLAVLANSWAAGTGSVLAEHRASRTVAQVTERLTAASAGPTQCGTVVLAVPDGEQHTLVLAALAHLLRDAGHATQVVDALPHRELLELAAAPGTIAVLLSVHSPLPGPALRSLLRDLRAAGPEVLLAVGGPGAPPVPVGNLGADLVGDDLSAFLTALDGVTSALTEREAQVLSAVADGLTNNDIARRLGVAPATVKSHMDNIFVKTRTEHRAAAVARALRRGWIG